MMTLSLYTESFDLDKQQRVHFPLDKISLSTMFSLINIEVWGSKFSNVNTARCLICFRENYTDLPEGYLNITHTPL